MPLQRMLSMKSNAEKHENEGIHAQNMSKLIIVPMDDEIPLLGGSYGATLEGGVNIECGCF